MILGILILAILVAVAGSALGVIRQALRLKRRTAALADSQLFVALANARGESLHLQRSLTMLTAQFIACKTALDSIRTSVEQLRAPQSRAEFARMKSEFGQLVDVLR